MRVLLVVATLAASLFVLNPPVHADTTTDEATIRQIVQEQQAAAWNRHDAAAYANLFAQDGDVVNVVGWWWKGRSEIQSNLTTAFAQVFKTSTLTITDVQTRFLRSDVAIAHVRWTMVGAKMPPSLPEPRVGIQTITLTKQSGRWLIAAFQNTNSLPIVPISVDRLR